MNKPKDLAKYGLEKIQIEQFPVTLQFFGIVALDDAVRVSLREFPSDFYQNEFVSAYGPSKCISQILKDE